MNKIVQQINEIIKLTKEAYEKCCRFENNYTYDKVRINVIRNNEGNVEFKIYYTGLIILNFSSQYLITRYSNNRICYGILYLQHNSYDMSYYSESGVITTFNYNCNRDELDCKLFQFSTTDISDDTILLLELGWIFTNTFSGGLRIYSRQISLYEKVITELKKLILERVYHD